MSFMAVSVQKSGLRGHFVFASVHEDPRFLRVDTVSPRNQVHHFRLARVEDIDARFISWISEAYRVGEQRHLGKDAEARHTHSTGRLRRGP
jgi:hypothetical protein